MSEEGIPWRGSGLTSSVAEASVLADMHTAAVKGYAFPVLKLLVHKCVDLLRLCMHFVAPGCTVLLQAGVTFHALHDEEAFGRKRYEWLGYEHAMDAGSLCPGSYDLHQLGFTQKVKLLWDSVSHLLQDLRGTTK